MTPMPNWVMTGRNFSSTGAPAPSSANRPPVAARISPSHLIEGIGSPLTKISRPFGELSIWMCWMLLAVKNATFSGGTTNESNMPSPTKLSNWASGTLPTLGLPAASMSITMAGRSMTRPASPASLAVAPLKARGEQPDRTTTATNINVSPYESRRMCMNRSSYRLSADETIAIKRVNQGSDLLADTRPSIRTHCPV